MVSHSLQSMISSKLLTSKEIIDQIQINIYLEIEQENKLYLGLTFLPLG